MPSWRPTPRSGSPRRIVSPTAVSGGTLVQWVATAAGRLRAAGYVNADREARELAEWALSLRRTEFWSRPDRPLSDPESARLEALVEGRLRGIPLQYLTRRASFRNLDVAVGPGVLVPRPETEGLVDHVLEFLRASGPAGPVLELGVGSGAILASLLGELPELRGVGVELSRLALEFARSNLEAAAVLDRALLLEGNLFAPLGEELAGTFAAIVSNPPYIPETAWEELPRDVRDFEPRLALLGGTDGLDVIRRLVAGSGRWLVPGGLLALEIDATQGEAVEELLVATGEYEKIRTAADLAGRPRYSLARTRRRSLPIRDGRRVIAR